MKNIFGSLRKSLLRKIIALFILFLVPIFILSSIIYVWSTDSIREKIISSESTQLKYYLDKFEKEIVRINSIQYEFLNDNELNKLSTSPKSMNFYEYQLTLTNLQQRLSFLKNSSEYVENAQIFIFGVGKMISTISGISDIPARFSSSEEFGKKATNSLYTWYDNKLMININGPVFYKVNSSYIPYVVQVIISTDDIKNDLLRLNDIDGFEKSITSLMDKSKQYSIDNKKSNEVEEKGLYRVLDEVQTENDQKILYTKADSKNVIAIAAYSNLLNLSLVRVIPGFYFSSQSTKYVIWLYIFMLVSLLIIILFFLMISRLVYKPLKNVLEAFKEVENGNMDVVIKHKKFDEFRFLYQGFNKMIEKIKNLFEQVYQYKILAQHAEMKRLQSQINPHFLYNSFYILHRLAEMEDCEGISNFSHKLAKYYQYITRDGDDEVALEKEVGYAKIYTEIQEIRFNKRIKIEFGEIPDEFKALRMPRMILQPVIENAFEHGLRNKISNGLIRIRFEQVNGGMAIYIEDNGDELKDEDMEQLANSLDNVENIEEITAIINIHRRLQIKYGNRSGIHIGRSEYGGLPVGMMIIFKEENDV